MHGGRENSISFIHHSGTQQILHLSRIREPKSIHIRRYMPNGIFGILQSIFSEFCRFVNRRILIPTILCIAFFLSLLMLPITLFGWTISNKGTNKNGKWVADSTYDSRFNVIETAMTPKHNEYCICNECTYTFFSAKQSNTNLLVLIHFFSLKFFILHLSRWYCPFFNHRPKYSR